MTRQIPLPFSFNPEHGFEEFHPGGNAEAVEHLRRAASGQGERLIFLWGESGLGKTHLLHACCREAYRAGRTVSFLPLKNLRDYGCAVLEGIEHQQWVCLDDIESIAGDPAWEQGLFDLFNHLRDADHGLIATAAMPPAELPILLPDLKTRLSWGLTLMLRPLTDEDKLSALSLRAKLLGLDLSPQVGRFLLGTHQRDLPGLLALLDRLDRATLAAKRKLTIPFLKDYLEENP
ncbi:MAG: DnaA regulatory inactivator Hda [Methylococcaceae bacterium]|nr:DnaA regulatory inactivator Hda [Methylococcaceae bacterium]